MQHLHACLATIACASTQRSAAYRCALTSAFLSPWPCTSAPCVLACWYRKKRALLDFLVPYRYRYLLYHQYGMYVSLVPREYDTYYYYLRVLRVEDTRVVARISRVSEQDSWKNNNDQINQA